MATAQVIEIGQILIILQKLRQPKGCERKKRVKCDPKVSALSNKMPLIEVEKDKERASLRIKTNKQKNQILSF